MKRVFSPHETLRRDRVTGELSPAHDFSAALEYGQLVVLLPSGFPPDDTGVEEMLVTLRGKLATYTDEDFILATGDPATMGAVLLMAATFNSGRVKVLRWDRHAGRYNAVQIDMRRHTGER